MNAAYGVSLLMVLGIVIYLIASRLLGPPRAPAVIPADLLAVMSGAADITDVELARYGHDMTWQDAGGPGGREVTTGTCGLCGGVSVVSPPETGKHAAGTLISPWAPVEYRPPLASGGTLLACTGARGLQTFWENA